MAWQALITDLTGVARKFVGDYESMSITRRLGDFSEFKLVLDPRDSAAGEVLIAERCLKVYDGASLRFFGQIWEPLEFQAGYVSVPSRDPFAGLAWRRVRSEVTYTAQDAGAIAYARLAAQNAVRDTFLTGQSSIVRSGTLADESAIVTISPTNDLRAGMGVAGIFGTPGGVTPKILEVVDSSHIKLNTVANIQTGVKDCVATSGSPTLTGFGDISDIDIGMTIASARVPAGTTVLGYDNVAHTVTMSANATSSGATTATFTAPATQNLTLTENASVNRTITYPPGKKEDEIVKELSGMSDGFFFRVDPLDGVPGKMGVLRVLYPDAGTTRSEIRFGYGDNSVDNLQDFKVVHMLPLTRMTAASQDPAGGRIAASAEDGAATAQFGLFEDEIAYTDLDDTALLQVQADAGTKPTPPLVIELEPNTNAPLLFTDFDVGDFVKLNIGHGEVQVSEWVRVIEATMQIDKQGEPTLTKVVIETLSGSRVSQDPARLFRAQLDANRQRLEALERRVQEITTTAAAAPPPPTDSGGSGGSSAPPPDPTPEEPPPPPPDRVPGVAMSSASGFYDDRGRGVHLVGAVSPFDSTTSTTFIIRSGSESGTVVKITPARLWNASNNLYAVIEDTTLLSSGTYYVAINGANAAGQSTSGYISFFVPSVRQQ